MSKEIDEIATMPIEEFVKLDPDYWSEEANDFYNPDYEFVDEASKRGLRRDRDRKIAKMKDGEIWRFNVDIKKDPRRPCLVLKSVPGEEQPVICFVCTTRGKHKMYAENIPIKTPLLWGELDHPESHVAVNRRRYLNDMNITPVGNEPIGEVHPDNLEEIKKRYVEVKRLENEKRKKRIDEALTYFSDDIRELLEDI